VGGKAVFVNMYNRRVAIRGCRIWRAGANGIAFVGDRDYNLLHRPGANDPAPAVRRYQALPEGHCQDTAVAGAEHSATGHVPISARQDDLGVGWRYRP